MDNIKEKAIEFLVANNLGEMPKNMLKLNNYNLDFKIMTYAEASELIVQKNWEYYTENYKGFTACMPDGEKWIFYSEKLPYSERNFVITHEIGHDVLGHVVYSQILGKSKNKSDKISESLQEKEADAFALALLAPPAVLLELGCYSPREISKVTGLPSDISDLAAIEVIKEQSMKKTKLESRLLNVFNESIEKHRYIQEKQEPIIIAIPSQTIGKPKTSHNLVIFLSISSSIVVCLLILILNHTFNFPPPQVNTHNKENTYRLEENTKNNDNTDTTVYVSSTKKYHLENCRFAMGGIPTPLSEAVKSNYTPCKVCNPSKK